MEDDPINSVAEFVVEICLDVEDTLPGDERESESEHFNGFGKILTFYNSGYTALPKAVIKSTDSTPVTAREINFICKGYMTVFSPPPEFS
jgi:acyl-coenzyme A synthetase/AMP-(fatty) acid ligase